MRGAAADVGAGTALTEEPRKVEEPREPGGAREPGESKELGKPEESEESWKSPEEVRKKQSAAEDSRQGRRISVYRKRDTLQGEDCGGAEFKYRTGEWV